MINHTQCRVCRHATFVQGIDALNRTLFRCPQCDYVCVSKTDFLRANEEKERYSFHNNSIEDKEYVKFLERILNPLEKFLRPDDLIIDYGSGPEPVFKKLLEKKGFHTFIFDPFFSPTLPEETYNALIATEVFEHFQNPEEEIGTILSLVDSKGYIGIMTLKHTEETDFGTWHYARDPTHVGFFSDRTFEWIEKQYKLERVYDDGERVLIFKKR